MASVIPIVKADWLTVGTKAHTDDGEETHAGIIHHDNSITSNWPQVITAFYRCRAEDHHKTSARL